MKILSLAVFLWALPGLCQLTEAQKQAYATIYGENWFEQYQRHSTLGPEETKNTLCGEIAAWHDNKIVGMTKKQIKEQLTTTIKLLHTLKKALQRDQTSDLTHDLNNLSLSE